MDEFKVWVGCLACYNEGRLIGEWFDAIEAPQDAKEFNDAVEGHLTIDGAEGHEEFWCLDTDNSPVSGEMSPSEAVEYAELIEDLSIPMEALTAWLESTGETLTADAVETAESRFIGDEEAFDDVLDNCYPADDLPDWAQSSYGVIIENIRRDWRLGGDVVELGDYYFWTR